MCSAFLFKNNNMHLQLPPPVPNTQKILAKPQGQQKSQDMRTTGLSFELPFPGAQGPPGLRNCKPHRLRHRARVAIRQRERFLYKDYKIHPSYHSLTQIQHFEFKHLHTLPMRSTNIVASPAQKRGATDGHRGRRGWRPAHRNPRPNKPLKSRICTQTLQCR